LRVGRRLRHAIGGWLHRRGWLEPLRRRRAIKWLRGERE
jgi:hypothetical protein